MRTLYSSEMSAKLRETNKRKLFISLIPLAVVIPLYILFLIVAEEDTERLYQMLSTILFTLWSWFFIFELTYHILPDRTRMNHIDRILSVEKTEVEGRVEAIGNPITLERSVHIREILIVRDYERHKTYFNTDLNECGIRPGDTVKALLANNFIFSYEVEGQ